MREAEDNSAIIPQPKSIQANMWDLVEEDMVLTRLILPIILIYYLYRKGTEIEASSNGWGCCLGCDEFNTIVEGSKT